MHYLEISADYKKYLDFLVFFIAPFILFLKSNDDRKFKLLSFRITKSSNFLVIISPFLYILTLIFAFSNFFNKNLLDDSIISFCIGTAATTSILKRKYKLFNSIEEIYEAILELTVIFFILFIIDQIILNITTLY